VPGDKRTLRSYAKELRRKQTDAERVLWMRLRARQILGLKFRRQHPIGGYIVDFCCPEAGLVVELDGSQHVSQASADQYWTEFLLQEGYQVLRYWNHEVLTVPDAVLQHIANTVSDPHPHPLPERAMVRKNKKIPER
jgi:very-short-patch-repair endonuclease